ncbi:hypothetical protein [Nocardia sp. NPDC020380]|uniref:hypothetical protein n=1 Tax=Nocardia sp. NPDC020380 TaxID=3364309 RepID=UPI0037A3BE06
MSIATRGGILLLSVATLVGVSAGVASAAVPGPGPAPVTITPPLKPVDANDDYNNAVAAQTAQAQSASIGAGLAGAAIGAVPGCLVGGLMGLPIPPAEVLSIPFGCLMGAVAGGGIGAALASGNVINATEPDVMQKCSLAMPAWACQIRENQRLDPDDDNPVPPLPAG